MASTTELTVRLVPETADLVAALEVVAKHVAACAQELRSLGIPTRPTMQGDAVARISEAARDHVLDPRNDVL